MERGQGADTEYRPAKEKQKPLRLPQETIPHTITKQKAKCQTQRSRPRPACTRLTGRGTSQGRHQAERHTALQVAPKSNAQGERTPESSPGRKAPQRQGAQPRRGGHESRRQEQRPHTHTHTGPGTRPINNTRGGREQQHEHSTAPQREDDSRGVRVRVDWAYKMC